MSAAFPPLAEKERTATTLCEGTWCSTAILHCLPAGLPVVNTWHVDGVHSTRAPECILHVLVGGARFRCVPHKLNNRQRILNVTVPRWMVILHHIDPVRQLLVPVVVVADLVRLKVL